MICYFVANQKSAFYESDKFTNVLTYIQLNPRGCKMSEKNGKLRLVFAHIDSIQQAVKRITELNNVPKYS